MASQDLIPHAQLTSTFGVLFIGVILAAILFGVTNVQAFIYFQTHSHCDTGITFHKLVVICFWILDALHLALIVHCVHFYLVINYANISALSEIVWSAKLQAVVAASSIFAAHLLYVHRIWTVSKGRSKVLAIIVGIAVVLTLGYLVMLFAQSLRIFLGLTIVIFWFMYLNVHATADLVKMEWAIYVYLGPAAFVDILIASSLYYLLATSRTGFPRTDLFISKLMVYIINTGCLTSMCSMAAIITCAVISKNFVFEAVEFLMFKLYVNSFIVLMNAGYYAQPNVDAMHSCECSVRYDIYRPRLRVGMSQDEEQASQKSMFNRPDEVLHITRPVQAVMPRRPIEVTTEMNFSLFSMMNRLRGPMIVSISCEMNGAG
ncbi:uncharacterized protein F5147DRAFT_726600 [Suillus discolor]|uniref:DUF6534 domain-containing protein n=1 Tax=Suillus discolor TaxID=1912936 RepID=A0A9P7JM85_9AGAM|nr:uncharacterized protein F5147DRAFT_726600 [Suillus discolor]KAG2088747.1 hypothetical protein F5147DRAFT_726600 [Suillus discolor]